MLVLRDLWLLAREHHTGIPMTAPTESVSRQNWYQHRTDLDMTTPTSPRFLESLVIRDQNGQEVDLETALRRIIATDGSSKVEPDRFYFIPVTSLDDDPVAVLATPTERNALIDQSVQTAGSTLDPRSEYEQRILPRLTALNVPMTEDEVRDIDSAFFSEE